MYMLYVYNMLQYNKNGYNDNIKNGLTDILSSFILLYYIIYIMSREKYIQIVESCHKIESIAYGYITS